MCACLHASACTQPWPLLPACMPPPQYILKREVSKYERDHIMKGNALGELDHPNYASRYFKCLNLPNVSHQVRMPRTHNAQYMCV